jgi:hypothetical protein
MKKNNLLYLFLLLSNALFAQKITAQVIDASGGTQRANGYTITYSIGQTAIDVLANSTYIITQGFQQANTNVVTSTKNEAEKLDFQATIFPNPTQDVLNLNIESENAQDFKISLYNLVGQQILQESFSGNTHQIEVNQLPKGEYVLKLQKMDSQHFQ